MVHRDRFFIDDATHGAQGAQNKTARLATENEIASNHFTGKGKRGVLVVLEDADFNKYWGIGHASEVTLLHATENTKNKKEDNMNSNKSEPIYTKKMIDKMGIETIKFNTNATVVVLTDGRKGVSVVDSTDDPDRLVGIAVAYTYAMGTDGSKTQFKKNMIKINKHNGYKN